MSSIAAMSMKGVLDCYSTVGTVNNDKFKHFVETGLTPYLKPFNGVNAESIVVLDNASIHHVDGVIDAIQQTGALVQFLPPYSPDLNAIESLFCKLKSVLKANEQVWEAFDIETTLIAAFNTITPEDCQGWIRHCGY